MLGRNAAAGTADPEWHGHGGEQTLGYSGNSENTVGEMARGLPKPRRGTTTSRRLTDSQNDAETLFFFFFSFLVLMRGY